MSTAFGTSAPPATDLRARRSSLAGLLWLSIPFAIYVAVLVRLWFNAPIWDDYDAILNETMVLLDASPRKWIGMLVALHNEHRIAVARLGAWLLVQLFGHIDFRLMVAFGVTTFFGMLVLIWDEFRKDVAPPLFAAAGFVLFQWSYYEAALMGSAALANLTVVSFSFATLYFAMRDGWLAAAATVVFGILAVGSLASGLFALPIAAAGCMLARQRGRALLFGGVALALWGLYFMEYHRPAGHPSPFLGLTHPVEAARLFLVILGSMVPGIWLPTFFGLAILAALAWLTWKRAWKAHPTAALWTLFALASVAAATAGRVGFGVQYTSRYGTYSSALAVVILLLASGAVRSWTRARMAALIVAAAVLSLAVSVLIWRAVMEYSVNGHRLAKAVPAESGVRVQPYFGMHYPVTTQSEAILVAAEKRGIYVPRVERVFPTALRVVPSLPAGARMGGHLDNVVVSGNRVGVGGWTDIPAIVPQRTLMVFPADGDPKAGPIATDERIDVAMLSLSANLEFGGFHFELEYPDAESAKRAAAGLCIAVAAPSAATAILVREGVDCKPGQAAPARR